MIPAMRFMIAIAVLVCISAWPAAATETAIFSVHVGVNQPPTGSALAKLRFADDDAVRFYRFVQPFSRHSLLLSVLDESSQARNPQTALVSKPPRLGDLEQALDQLNQEMRAVRKTGQRVVFYFTYSGHGQRGEQGTRLAMLDGAIDPAWLEEHLFGLEADSVHLMVDACHAAGLVSPRGVIEAETSATSRPLTDTERAGLLRAGLLERYPHVGAILGASAGRESHEWSRLRGGVFTHELLSALSGAADVNVDGQIAYSEAAAFISAANRAVADDRARPQVVAMPPRLNHNAPILSLAWLKQPRLLRGQVGDLGRFHIEDERGQRLLEAHLESGQALRLLLPKGILLWIRAGEREARLEPNQAQGESLGQLKFQPPRVAARGATEQALRIGLFAKPFGKAYYQGYVEGRNELGVAFAKADPAQIEHRAQRPSRLASGLLFAGAGLGLAGAAVFGGLAIDARLDYQNTQLERPAQQALERQERYQYLAIGSATLCAALAIIGYLTWPEEKLVLVPSAQADGFGLTLASTF